MTTDTRRALEAARLQLGAAEDALAKIRRQGPPPDLEGAGRLAAAITWRGAWAEHVADLEAAADEEARRQTSDKRTYKTPPPEPRRPQRIGPFVAVDAEQRKPVLGAGDALERSRPGTRALTVGREE